MGEIHRLESGWVTKPCGFESYHFRMFIVSAIRLHESVTEALGPVCEAVDYALAIAAEKQGETSFPGCTQMPEYAVAFRPADDMSIPVNLCKIHFNALRLSLREGSIGIDDDLFGV